jgi:hypothetical protein
MSRDPGDFDEAARREFAALQLVIVPADGQSPERSRRGPV